MDIKCECGGSLRRVTIGRFDFTPFAGLPCELRSVAGLRCDQCGGETLEGEVINADLAQLTQDVVRLPRILCPDEAKFLRKRMELSQKDLAEHMGITRETVATWECGTKPLSKQNDYILRGLTLSKWFSQASVGVLSHVHKQSDAPPEPFVIDEKLRALRDQAASA